MSRIRTSAAAAVLLTVSGSALADGPARLAIPIPTVPGVALSQLLGTLPAVNDLLGGLGLTTGGGATALLPGLVPTIGVGLGDAIGTGTALVIGGRDSNTGAVLPGLLPAVAHIVAESTPGSE